MLTALVKVVDTKRGTHAARRAADVLKQAAGTYADLAAMLVKKSPDGKQWPQWRRIVLSALSSRVDPHGTVSAESETDVEELEEYMLYVLQQHDLLRCKTKLFLN